MPNNSIYTQLTVWKRPVAGQAVVYICFRRETDGKFCVQNVEFFYSERPSSQWERLLANTGELFMESDPSERDDWHDSLGQAIGAHDLAFADIARPG